MGGCFTVPIEEDDAVLVAKLKANAVLVDARVKKAYNQGHIDGAIHLAMDSNGFYKGCGPETVGLPDDKNTPIIVYYNDANGLNVANAISVLKKKGYPGGGYVDVTNGGSMARVENVMGQL